MSRAWIVTAVLAAGCPPFIWPGKHDDNLSGDVEETGDPSTIDDDTDEVRDTFDTDPGVEYAEPWFLAMWASFRYDQDAAQIAGYDAHIDGGMQTVPPFVGIAMHERQFNGTLGDVICVALVPLDDAQFWDLGDPAVQFGASAEWDTARVEHDCDGKVDPAIWGSDLANLQSLGVGFGATGAVSADTRSLLGQAYGESVAAEQFDPYAVGARAYVSTVGALTAGGTELWVGRVAQVDPSGVLMWNDTDEDGTWDTSSEHPLFEPSESFLTGGNTDGIWFYDIVAIGQFEVPLRDVLLP